MRRILIEEHWQGYRVYILKEKDRKAAPVICLTMTDVHKTIDYYLGKKEEGKEG